MSWGTATLRLLVASILNGSYGAFIIYIAYLMVGYNIRISNIIAGFLIIYAIYTFDRAKGGEEDDINRKELTKARKDIAYIICILSSLIGVLIFFLNDLLFVVIFPLITGYFYSMKINIGSFTIRLKGGCGMKNLIVALAWGIFITGIVVRVNTEFITIIAIFSFVFVKNFITTVMYDFRDIKGDKVAGLLTIPIYFGEHITRILLMSLHLLVHALVAFVMIAGILEFKFVILLSCFILGIIYIFFFAKPIDLINSRIKKILFYLSYKGELYIALGLQIVYSNFM